jgi:hypothetical protein
MRDQRAAGATIIRAPAARQIKRFTDRSNA